MKTQTLLEAIDELGELSNHMEKLCDLSDIVIHKIKDPLNPVSTITKRKKTNFQELVALSDDKSLIGILSIISKDFDGRIQYIKNDFETILEQL